MKSDPLAEKLYEFKDINYTSIKINQSEQEIFQNLKTEVLKSYVF